jgi:hypothetical protein
MFLISELKIYVGIYPHVFLTLEKKFYVTMNLSTIRIIKSRRMRLASIGGGGDRNEYRLLLGILEGKKPLGRPRHRWVDNIKMNLLAIGRNGVN